MKRAFILSILIIISVFTLMSLSVRGQAVRDTFKFGFVKEHDFAGDLIWLANTREKDRIAAKSIAIFSYNGLGTININGRDIELKQTDGYLADKNFKVGRGGYEVWRGNNITVRLNQTYTWLCPQKQENCSVYYYKGVLDVNYQGKRRRVNVNGFGGS